VAALPGYNAFIMVYVWLHYYGDEGPLVSGCMVAPRERIFLWASTSYARASAVAVAMERGLLLQQHESGNNKSNK